MDIKKIEEFADLTGVTIFRPGKHNSIDFTPEDMDAMVRNTNECLTFLQEAFDLNEYAENPHLDLKGQPIPGFINLNHQQYLSGLIKDAVKKVSVNFYTRLIDGVNHIVADFKGLSSDLAMFLKEKFPARSIELIPKLYNPKTGRWYEKVIRSVGFLDPAEMPPAVKGLSNDFVVSMQEEINIITLFLECDQQEEPIMESKKDVKDDTVITPSQEGVITAVEFAQMQKRLEQAEILARDQKKESDQKIAELQEKADRQEIEMYCKDQIAQGYAPALFDADFKHFMAYLGRTPDPVLEFAANGDVKAAKVNPRQAFQLLLNRVLQLAEKGALRVPIGEFAAQVHTDPLQSEPSKGEQQAVMIAEFADEAKIQAANPNDQREVFGIAYQLALKKYGDKLN